MAGSETGLPNPLTAFVGRRWELDELTEVVGRHRLVTLSGAGGCGKTRLAVELARRLQETLGLRVRFADLSAVDQAEFVLEVVAATAGAAAATDDELLDSLITTLGASPSLLILDTCEHLLDPIGELVPRLVGACPQLRILATSRERLRVAGEVAWTVPSLSVPQSTVTTMDAVGSSEAVELFVERARLANQAFVLTEENASEVAQICRLLDGIPLALELAAPWTRLIAPAQVVERLDARFEFLRSAPRGTVARHRTLKAAVDWSYERLEPNEQLLLRRLSVFAASFDVEACEQVCTDQALVPQELLDLLAGLVDKSILQVGADGGRYRLLDTIRQYARDRLDEEGESAQFEQRHASYFLGLADAAHQRLKGPERLRWLNRLEGESAELRRALEWAQKHDAEMSVRLLYLLAPYQMVRMSAGDVRDAERWLDRALAETSETSPIHAWALTERGWLAWRQADIEGAETHWTRALQLHRGNADARGIGEVLSQLGEIAGATGDWALAQKLLRQGLASSRSAGDHWRVAYSLFYLGLLAVRRGRPRDARPLLEQSLEVWRGTGDSLMTAYPLAVLGLAAVEIGDLEEARARLDQALEISLAHDYAWGNASLLQIYGALATALRRPDRALVLAGAAESAFERIRSAPSPFIKPALEAWFARARGALPAARAARWFSEGRAASTEEVLEMARALPLASARPGGLSAREAEIAALIGEGLATKEVAARLGISARTADTHLDHIREKLGLRSRTQVASWAVYNGLAAARDDSA